uniref:Dynein assembly factor 3, axonemal n=1 Tax=Timema douglasi TaxID=61478 RepID=A0A7R8VDK3_TIMDO|nr:unnamed protein product [Timema douglasi]
MYWGYSPALDLQTEWGQRGLSGSTDELRILIVGASDGRHILKTLAQSHGYAKRKLIFHVMEGSLELMARQMMLLTVALEPSQVLGLHEKTRLFLDIYGNILVRPNSARYVADKATQLIHMVTDPDYRQAKMPLLKLDRLKYKERDYLEDIFKFWQKDGNNIFHPRAHWDSRLRRHLGTRYDAKEGIFDWDYHMRLRPLGGERINSREYKHWRGTGIAFTWPETECSKPNCTLASGVVLIGDRLCHHGYLGDIVSGPYVNYGIECEDEDMLRKTNGVHNKRSTDIAERNLMRLFSELQTRQPYVSQAYPEGE